MKFRVGIVAFVMPMLIFATSDSEIYIEKEGDSIELICNCVDYYYCSYGVTMFVNQSFGTGTSYKTEQVWPRTWKQPTEYYHTNGRFNFTSESSNLTVSIVNLQLNDAGSYSCWDYYIKKHIATHIVIVIGREVNLSINKTGKYQSQLDCSFNVSNYPETNETEIVEIDGAVGSNTTKEGFTVRRKFEATSTRSRSFTCKVKLPFGIHVKSLPASLILEDDKQIDENVIIRHGDSSLLLSCISLHPSNKQWKWFKEKLYYGNQLSFPIIDCFIKSSTDECFNQTSHDYLEDVSIQSYTFLRFTNIPFEATGSYICIDDFFTVQKVFNVIVLDDTLSNMTINDQLIENNSTFEIRRGNRAIITCSILMASGEDEEGRYHPKLIVEKSQYVYHGVDGAYLVYTYETIINQSGTFTCFVEIPNDYQVIGNFSNYTINVDVFYCPEELKISSEMESGTFEHGTILSCTTSAKPAANVTWTAANKALKLETGPNYADLRVYEKIIYTCQTKPSFHTALGHCQTLETTVKPKLVLPRQYLEIPRFVQLGEFVTLQCTTLHHKNNNWKWIRNWNPNSNAFLDPLVDCLLEENVECSNISSSGRFRDYSSSSETLLIIFAAALGDIGNYTCFDSLRTVIKTFKVDVLVCPSKLVISKKYAKGETELNCSVTSNPPVNVTWTLGNDPKPLAVGLNSVKLVVTQNGSYRCFVPQTSHSFLGKCGDLSLTGSVNVNE